MLTTLLSIIWKNFKLVFRSPSLLFLVVLGPMILILIVGTAFSSMDIKGLNFGVVSKTGEFSAEMLSKDLGVNAIALSDRNDCVNNLIDGNFVACIIVSKTEDQRAEVEVLYDGSKAGLAQLITSHMKSFLGIKSEDISVKATTEVLSEINDLLIFARSAQTDIQLFLSQVKEMKRYLDDAERDLISTKKDISTQELELKQTKKELDDIEDTELEEDEQEAYSKSINSLSQAEEALLIASSLSTDDNITEEINTVSRDISEIKDDIHYYHQQFQESIQALRTARNTVDNSLDRLQITKETINDNIFQLSKAENDASTAIQKLEQIKRELQARLPASFKEEELAKQLATPFIVNLKDILEGEYSTVQIMFPLIATTVAMFIAVMLSNILTLSEIHNSAYLRTSISPVSSIWFTLGILLTNMILVLIQMSVLFYFSWNNFGINLLTNFSGLGLVIISEVLMFTIIGMLIAYLVNSQNTSVLIATFTILINFLISDSIFPVATMPAVIQGIANINPLLVHLELFRKALFFNFNFEMLWSSMLALWLISWFGFYLINVADWNFRKRNLN